MDKKNFVRKIEDFICENCGYTVDGNGYTNHCPRCLYSKHVDILPGDRDNICQGLMKPIGILKKSGEWKIIHKCLKCSAEKLCKVDDSDDRELIVKLSSDIYNSDSL